MNKEEIFNFLKRALMELFEIQENKITLEARIYEDLEIDSIDAIDLVDYVKKQTGHKLSPEDFKAIKTLGDIVEVVAKKYEIAN